ncbi:MAG TPA: efflux RND transporter periplasmic adaptor subunit [Candidatus Sulfotelmatobacter sp.]|nr:efflux RND transporter periplasmic adaptor subunit [Candidatus Sulfotelmatobacter sp.]
MKTIVLALLGLPLLVLGTSCTRTPVPTAAAATPTVPETVITPPPSTQDFTASGPIVVENQVDVAAQRGGVVTQILAEPGTRVRQGQLLAKLDDRQLNADLEAARAKTASIEADLNNWKAEAKVLEADFQRAKKMWEAKLIPEEQFEHARYKAEADQWDVRRVEQLLVNSRDSEQSLELELAKTQITAPFDGIVARRYIRVGQTVTIGERLLWVTATAPLRVRFTLPSRFLNQIKPGQQIGVKVNDGDPKISHQAKIMQVSPVVDPASGTIEVLAELTGSVQDLRPGMQADVHLPAHP